MDGAEVVVDGREVVAGTAIGCVFGLEMCPDGREVSAFELDG